MRRYTIYFHTLVDIVNTGDFVNTVGIDCERICSNTGFNRRFDGDKTIQRKNSPKG